LSTAKRRELVSNIKMIHPGPLSAKTTNVSFGGVQMLGTPSSEGLEETIPAVEEEKKIPSASILKSVRGATPEGLYCLV
jgi:hypothetical protein